MNIADEKLVALIRQTFPPLSEPPPSNDLWPRFERRLNARRMSVGPLDRLMAAAVLGLLAGFPEAVLLVLYQL